MAAKATNHTSIVCLASNVPSSVIFSSSDRSPSAPKTAVRLSENVTAKPLVFDGGSQFCGAQARKRAGIVSSSWTCFVHSCSMLGCLEPGETLNKATHPVLLAMANLFLSCGWKWRSKTAYGSASLWIRDLGLRQFSSMKNTLVVETYNSFVPGSSFHNCTLPVLVC